MWCVAELDEEYIRRMEDILAIYEKPLSELEPVVCIDEKPVVLHADLRPSIPLQPGRELRRPSTNVAAPPTPSAAWSRRPDVTLPKQLRIVPRPSSPTICWRLPNTIRQPTPSIW